MRSVRRLAYLRNVVERFAKQTLDKAGLHNEDIYGPDSDEYPDVKGDTAKGGLAGRHCFKGRKERSKDEGRNEDIESDNGEAGNGKAGEGEAEKEKKENGKERKRGKGSGGEER